jgi:bifunctional DNA-binding transcriptional regulator/antitoxin component of YhaV-PrlF toxin-antitoxin module
VSIQAVKVILRTRNQLTLPESIVQRLGVKPGDEVIISIDDDEPGVVRLRPLRRSYAGVARGNYGTAAEAVDYLKNERAAWNE